MADPLELDESGQLLVNGQPHIPDSPEEFARKAALTPKFCAALRDLRVLIAHVDHPEWQATTTDALVRLISATQEEIFPQCCPMCRATIEAVFGAGAATIAS